MLNTNTSFERRKKSSSNARAHTVMKNSIIVFPKISIPVLNRIKSPPNTIMIIIKYFYRPHYYVYIIIIINIFGFPVYLRV